MPIFLLKMNILSILAKSSEKQKLNFPRSVQFNNKARGCLAYFAHDSRYKKIFIIFLKKEHVYNVKSQKNALKSSKNHDFVLFCL